MYNMRNFCASYFIPYVVQHEEFPYEAYGFLCSNISLACCPYEVRFMTESLIFFIQSDVGPKIWHHIDLCFYMIYLLLDYGGCFIIVSEKTN